MLTPFTLPGRFTALDGWRGICALLVATYHFHTTSHLENLAFVRHAYLLVDFFFVLSGFVITAAYIGRLHTLRDAGVMIWRRLGRLWPLHVSILAVLVALELVAPLAGLLLGTSRSAAGLFDPQSPAQLSAVPSHLLLMQGLGVHDKLTWNIPSWSISAEAWVYAVFAAAMLLMRRWSLPAAIGLGLAGLAVLVAFSGRYMAVDYDLGFFRCLYGFFAGHLVHRAIARWPVAPRFGSVVEIGTVVLIVTFVANAGRTPFEFAAPLVFSFAVWVFAMERGVVSAAMKRPPLTRLGLHSYSIYMVHALVILIVHRGMTVIEQRTGSTLTTVVTHAGESARALAFGNAWIMDGTVLVYLAVVAGLAALSWRFVEMPAQRWWNAQVSNEPGNAMQQAAPDLTRSVVG